MTSYFNTTIGQREQLDRLLDQAGLSHEDVKRILADPTLAAKMVAALRTHPIQFASSTYVRVEQQLFRWQRLGAVISDEQWKKILQQADDFIPVTDSDEPLVTGGFGYNNPATVVKKLCSALTPRRDYAEFNFLDEMELRYAPGLKPKGGLRLVHYDSNAYPNLSPEDARKAAKKDGLRLAGIEVFEHLMLEPKTGFTWDGKLYFFPNASGLDLKCYSTVWSDVPFVGRADDPNDSGFYFGSGSAHNVLDGMSSPVVREC